VALAAGAAGAFAIGREDVSDTLPGVAIAISLIPPLSVVGIALGVWEPGAAAGAFSLFVTNFLAVLLAGGTVLSIMGYGRGATSTEHRKVRRLGFAAVVAGTLLIGLPLSGTARGVLQVDRDQYLAARAVKDWLGTSPADVLGVTVSDNAVNISIASAAADKQLDQDLVDRLTRQLGRRVRITLRVLPEQRYIPSEPA
jgi:uncharacterized membrane protein